MGCVFDGANTVIYAILGKWGYAALSGVSFIPFGDIFGKGGKVAGKIGKLFSKADEGAELVELAVKTLDEDIELVGKSVGNIAEASAKAGEEAAEVVAKSVDELLKTGKMIIRKIGRR